MFQDGYNVKDRFSQGPWCKVGDWVVFARYAGSRIEIEGGEVRLLNDDEVLEVTPVNLRLRKKYLDPHERKRAAKL